MTKLPKGRWRARIRHGGRDFYGERGRTKREAVASLPEVRERAFGPQDTDEPTVAAYIREYLDGRREELARNSWRLSAHDPSGSGWSPMGQPLPPVRA